MSNKMVIFDLDGTLLDTLGDLTGAVNYVLDKNNYGKRSIDEVREFVGNGAKKLIVRSLPDGCDEAEIEARYIEFKEYYNNNFVLKTYAYAGVSELIDFLNENNIICSVVTNKPHATAEKLCQIYFPGKFVKCIGDIVGNPRKPDPYNIINVMREFDVSEAIYVGDSDVDVKSARNANIPCISVSWGFRDRDFLIENGADILVDNASELCKEILKIFSLPHLQNKFDEVMK